MTVSYAIARRAKELHWLPVLLQMLFACNYVRSVFLPHYRTAVHSLDEDGTGPQRPGDRECLISLPQ